jgi:nucleotide-binding universal stress UspA family protein
MSNSQGIIVVPVDFSEQSIIALEQAISLASYFGAKINLLYVRETGLERFFGKALEEIEKIEEKFKNLQAHFSSHGVPMEYVVEDGLVHEKILKYSTAVNAMFIIMGVNTGEKYSKKLMGDTVLKVVRESKIQVITIKGKKHRVGCSNIVLPLDLTEGTTQKVANAIEFAKYGACSIRIVTVLFSTDDYVVGKLVRQMEEVRNLIDTYHIECTAELIKAIKGEETTAQVIIDYAEKVEGDLIMIMTQQEKSEEEKIIGSTAEEIIMDSDIPVLSIIPQKKRQELAKSE